MGTDRHGAGPRQSGPLGKRGFNDPPNLAEYSDDTMFDLATMVQIIGVRPTTLWTWEQHLNNTRVIQTAPPSGPLRGRRYSERDLRAMTWLRDQIMAGYLPAEAAERLIAAQGATTQPGAPRPPVSAPHPTPPTAVQVPTPERWSQGSGPNWVVERPAGISGQLPIEAPRRSPSITTPLPQANAAAPPIAGPRPVPHGPQRGSHTSGAQWPAAAQAATRELRSLVSSLARAFGLFDTASADRIMNEVLAVRPLESTCIGLLLPALARVGENASRHQAAMSEERFAATYARARLYQVFAQTAERPDGPLVTVACGPREWHDIGALTLATFFRRAGMRVVFLGQDMEGDGLVEDSRLRRPRLVCVSVMSTQRLRALGRIARDINHIGQGGPVFTYSGAVFARNPELRRRIEGTYLGDDPMSATWQALRLLSANPRVAAGYGGTGQAG
jgi:methylmalonyl-CoA mutase cobalamin-binding subunit